MPKPSDTTIATKDSIELLPSGEVALSLVGQPRFVLRRPTVGEYIDLLGTYRKLLDEALAVSADRTDRDRQDADLQVGPRWFTHVTALLGPAGRDEDDSVAVPAWAISQSVLFRTLTNHWLTLPLASGPPSPEPSATTGPRALMFPAAVPATPNG